MSTGRRQLYHLLPTWYRQRDVEEGHPLRALLDLLEEELEVLEGDLESLYDNWFIETCDRRLIPYIGDLVGVREGPLGAPPTRAQVANALAARRRKGTRAALEAALASATGWGTYVVEHLPRQIAETRDELDIVVEPGEIFIEEIEAIRTSIETPFGSRVEEERSAPGIYESGGLAIYLWQRPSTPLEWSDAKALGAGRFTFDPAGLDRQLLNLPVRLNETFQAVGARQLPIRITHRGLRQDLEDLRAGRPRRDNSLARVPAIRIAIPPGKDKPWQEIAPSRFWEADLSDWEPPRTSDDAWDVAIDPELGRMLFREAPHGAVACWCSSWPALLDSPAASAGEGRVYNVCRHWYGPPSHKHLYASVEAAVKAWQAKAGPAIISILDSGTYAAPHNPIVLPESSKLRIQGAPGELPTLEGVWHVHASRDSGPLELSRLRFAGPIETQGPVLLSADRCLLSAATQQTHGHHVAEGHHPALRASESTDPVVFHLTDCACGPVEMPTESGRFEAVNTILEAHHSHALRAGIARLNRCTIFGEVDVDEIEEAVDVIFAGGVQVSKAQGELRFCALPSESRTPPQFRCFPIRNADRPIENWFVSTVFGQGGYAQLRPDSPAQVQTGAEDGFEIGAYHDLGERAVWAMVTAVLEEYLPFGLRADVYFVA